MKKQLAILAAKTTRRLSLLAGKQGTDLPGRVARMIDPQILSKIVADIPEIIFISGTNGKTTTSNLIGWTLKQNGYHIVHNNEGANMASGITAAFILQTDGQKHAAVIEIDEGSIPRVFKEIQPTKMIFTNFFRDQIDRFGEIDLLVQKIIDTIKPFNIELVLNGDDPFVNRLSVASDKVTYYGMARDIYQFEQSTMVESKFCPNCGKALIYDWTHYNQIGHYHCSCGFHRPTPKYEVQALQQTPFLVPTINTYQFNMKIAGDFNVFNVLAAYSVLHEMGLTDEQIDLGFSSYTSNNGRMQVFEKNGQHAVINLAKNPAGFNASLSMGEQLSGDKQYLLALNDNAADGLDISWIWDTDFEKLSRQQITRIICTGSRAEELALRLKYAEINVETIVLPNIAQAVALLSQQSSYAVCVPNYTALQPMLTALQQQFK